MDDLPPVAMSASSDARDTAESEKQQSLTAFRSHAGARMAECRPSLLLTCRYIGGVLPE
ncbi:hypothetical protein [Burkholderia diffusa]|uniref:hypothetical protein n=1 Tax=Burkholderia diffusa TaxID=488732 RepID=UPI00158188E6|nr:hypothetical protein [Burkholderia diffusa]